MFGSLLERRFGWFAVVFVFLAAGAAGAAAAVAADLAPPFEDGTLYLVLGANGAALGLLSAWFVEDRRAARRGDERDNDLLGVYVFAALLAAAAARGHRGQLRGRLRRRRRRARCSGWCCRCSRAADGERTSPTRSSIGRSRR